MVWQNHSPRRRVYFMCTPARGPNNIWNEHETKHLQNASKEYEILETKQQTIFTCFWLWSLSGEALETILGWGPPKTQKHVFGGPSFGSIFVTCVDIFVVTFLLMITEPLSFHLCAPIDTHRPQFQRLLATKFGTD